MDEIPSLQIGKNPVPETPTLETASTTDQRFRTMKNPGPAADLGTEPVWPRIPISEWEAARDTVHLWTQVIGKVRLAFTPFVNHWWNVPLYVSAHGLTTSLMHTSRGAVEIEFDFVDHALVVRTATGMERQVALQPRSVADFYEATMTALEDIGLEVRIFARPVELPRVIPFAEDTEHDAYDPDAIHRFWLALVQAHRVFTIFRSRFVGKASPIHFFWGSFDLTASRFSGRPAPKHPGGVPHVPDWVQHLAYNQELSSCGFWPGGAVEGSFYSYAYPEPDGYSDRSVRPEGAFYDRELREFLLPYEVVRLSDDPDTTLLDFLQSTYEAAAVLGRWDRLTLESTQSP